MTLVCRTHGGFPPGQQCNQGCTFESAQLTPYYTTVSLPLSPVLSQACSLCGALVHDISLHNNWHNSQ